MGNSTASPALVDLRGDCSDWRLLLVTSPIHRWPWLDNQSFRSRAGDLEPTCTTNHSLPHRGERGRRLRLVDRSVDGPSPRIRCYPDAGRECRSSQSCSGSDRQSWHPCGNTGWLGSLDARAKAVERGFAAMARAGLPLATYGQGRQCDYMRGRVSSYPPARTCRLVTVWRRSRPGQGRP